MIGFGMRFFCKFKETSIMCNREGKLMETVWFDELDEKYKCKDCYIFNAYDNDCMAAEETHICGDFMTMEEYETGVRLTRKY